MLPSRPRRVGAAASQLHEGGDVLSRAAAADAATLPRAAAQPQITRGGECLRDPNDPPEKQSALTWLADLLTIV